MIKFSSLAIIVTTAVGITAPAIAQIVVPPGGLSYDPPLFYAPAPAPSLFYAPAPAPPLFYAPAPSPFLWSPYSNHPAVTGGGSYGYNVKVLRDN
jgi:hypothetical protein